MPRVWLAKEASPIPFPLSSQIGLFLYNAREKKKHKIRKTTIIFQTKKIICPPYSKFLTLMSCTGQLELKIFIPWALVSLSFTFVSFNGWNFLVLTVHILYVTETDNIHWKKTAECGGTFIFLFSCDIRRDEGKNIKIHQQWHAPLPTIVAFIHLTTMKRRISSFA